MGIERTELTKDGITCLYVPAWRYYTLRMNEGGEGDLATRLSLSVDKQTLAPVELHRHYGQSRIARSRDLDMKVERNMKLVRRMMAGAPELIGETIALHEQRSAQFARREAELAALRNIRWAGPLMYNAIVVFKLCADGGPVTFDAAELAEIKRALEAAENGPYVTQSAYNHEYRVRSGGVYGDCGEITIKWEGQEIACPAVRYFRREDDPIYREPDRHGGPDYREIVVRLPSGNALRHDLFTGIETIEDRPAGYWLGWKEGTEQPSSQDEQNVPSKLARAPRARKGAK